MSVAYTLFLVTTSTERTVAAELCAVAAGAGLLAPGTDPAVLLDDGAALPSGMLITVAAARWVGTIPDDLGIDRPTVSVRFWRDSLSQADQQKDMAQVVLALLGRVPGDAVLHFQFDVAWLLRRGGQLFLSEGDDFWRPERLAIVTQPYQRMALPLS
jgi:hypothetical protein